MSIQFKNRQFKPKEKASDPKGFDSIVKNTEEDHD